MPIASLAGYAVKDMASSSPVPEATYRLRIHEFEFNDPTDPEWKRQNPTSTAKFPNLNVSFVIQDETVPGPEAGSTVPVFGRYIFCTLTFKKGGDFMLRQLVEAVGKEDDWQLIDDQGEPHWNELIDAEVLATVIIQPEREDPNTHQKYAAKNEVKKFMKLF